MTEEKTKKGEEEQEEEEEEQGGEEEQEEEEEQRGEEKQEEEEEQRGEEKQGGDITPRSTTKTSKTEKQKVKIKGLRPIVKFYIYAVLAIVLILLSISIFNTNPDKIFEKDSYGNIPTSSMIIYLSIGFLSAIVSVIFGIYAILNLIEHKKQREN